MEDLIKSIIKKDGLAKKCRTVDVVNKRIYLFNFLRNNGYTFNVIGNLFNLDHTTVMHAVKKVEELKHEDNNFNEDIELLKRLIDS